MFSVLSWWNDRRHALVNSLEDDRVCIIAPVCQKVLCPESRNQLRCNCAIRCGTRTDKESHRHTMRIHGQMYLGIEPPLCGPLSGSRPVHRRRRDVLCDGWCRSSVNQNPCHLPRLPEFFPRFPCRTTGKTGGVHSSSFHTFPVNPARVLQCEESRIPL